jgi:hypothetical protein
VECAKKPRAHATSHLHFPGGGAAVRLFRHRVVGCFQDLTSVRSNPFFTLTVGVQEPPKLMFKKRPRPQTAVAIDAAAASAASVGDAPVTGDARPATPPAAVRSPPRPSADGQRVRAAAAAAAADDEQRRPPQPAPSAESAGTAASTPMPDSRAVPGDGSRSLVCKMWAEKGVCKFGDGCQYAHIFDATRVRGINKISEAVASWKDALANLAPAPGGTGTGAAAAAKAQHKER